MTQAVKHFLPVVLHATGERDKNLYSLFNKETSVRILDMTQS